MITLFDIKRFALHDGPGIRTTLFMKGCPLHCVWCHNPEGIAPHPVKLYTRKKCIGCRSCVDICPAHALTLTPEGIVQSNRCVSCGLCTEECPTLALEMAGKQWSVDEVMQVVEKERQVMEESGGGVTVCGGEPLMHPEALLELLVELGHHGFHRTVDTTLYAPQRVVEQVLTQSELLLIDLKHMDAAAHRYFTGVFNERILENIKYVSSQGHPFWIRIPLIVGVNADETNLRASARFLASLPTPPEQVNFLSYHDIGKGKHVRMGTLYNPESLRMEAPDVALKQQACQIFALEGLEAKIGG